MSADPTVPVLLDPDPAVPTWTPTTGKALVLRTCAADHTSYHGKFTWPATGSVTCPDWEPTEECGHGLHGALWGAGDGGLLSWSLDALWQVVEVDTETVIDLGGKIKFPAGVVIYTGSRDVAVELVQAHAPAGTSVIGGTATAGDLGTATAGDRGTATAGRLGTATAGDEGTATAGYRGTATAGDEGTATAGDLGTATAGDEGTATAGYRGTATAGDLGTATAGDRGTATAGDGGCISILRWDPATSSYRRHIAVTAQTGPIKAGVAYRLDDAGEFVAVQS